MNNLFDDKNKIIKYKSTKSEQLDIKCVLNPYTQTYIDEECAKQLGIIYNGYYRNYYGGLIPLHIAASKGFVQYKTIERIEIEYSSKSNPIIANLIIDHVYDISDRTMITCQQAIDKNYIKLDSFLYSCSNVTMPINDAFSSGFILGELKTRVIDNKSIINVNDTEKTSSYDEIYSTLTNIINSLSEFRNTIHIVDKCELTSDGFIRMKKTGECYLLTQAIEQGLVSIKDASFRVPNNRSIHYLTTLIDDNLNSANKSLTRNETDTIRFFSDSFFFDLFGSTDCSANGSGKLENIKSFLPTINTY